MERVPENHQGRDGVRGAAFCGSQRLYLSRGYHTIAWLQQDIGEELRKLDAGNRFRGQAFTSFDPICRNRAT
ncbi:dehydrogenase domain protein, partial [Mycobacterium ulcerans str. Harvey]